MYNLKDYQIYLDYAATTPVDPKVREIMLEFLDADSKFGNPSSSHHYGIKAKEAIENARHEVASFVGANADEIIWTSGATESNNLAIKGAFELNKKKGKHIILSAIEHPSVINTCKYLQSYYGAELTFIPPNNSGSLVASKVLNAIRDDTILISVMHVNNETGSIQDIASIGDIVNDIIFHVDAAQSVGKIPINLEKLNVSLMSFSAHKVYGPKGIGALYVKGNPTKLFLVSNTEEGKNIILDQEL